MITLLSGCGKSSSIKNSSSTDTAQYYINKARQSSGEQRTHWLLLASEQLQSSKRIDKALTVLKSINPNDLTLKSSQHYHLLMAESLYSAGRNEQAILQFRQISNPTLLKETQLISYYQQSADLLQLELRFYDSAIQRIELSEYLTDQLDIEENRELLWQSLMQLQNIDIYQNSLNGLLITGWLELAHIAKEYANDPDELIKKLELWRNLFNEHPANQQMPLDMAHVESAKAYQPRRIAVLLPEYGSLANSANYIREGFMAAIYQSTEFQKPEIVFYDSSETTDILSLYQKAIDQGADFIIGPLHRDSVETLSGREQFPVPVLSINRLNEDNIVAENFYQFGLPIEDEARQAAIKAWEDGLNKVIVLVPEGNIGERTRSAFSKQFERLGGETLETIKFSQDSDFSLPVQQLLGVDKSIERFERLKQILAEPNIQHEARRRQDADFIYFKASVNQARRIKPFIDYYYALDLPLYSTSTIYAGKEDPVLDKDLNKVIFSDIPWVLSNEPDIERQREQVSTLWPNAVSSQSARLFALGYDLYTLIPDLNKLKNFPNYKKQGLSGRLSVNQLGHIQRELSWAQFVEGKTVELTNTIQSQ